MSLRTRTTARLESRPSIQLSYWRIVCRGRSAASMVIILSTGENVKGYFCEAGMRRYRGDGGQNKKFLRAAKSASFFLRFVIE